MRAWLVVVIAVVVLMAGCGSEDDGPACELVGSHVFSATSRPTGAAIAECPTNFSGLRSFSVIGNEQLRLQDTTEAGAVDYITDVSRELCQISGSRTAGNETIAIGLKLGTTPPTGSIVVNGFGATPCRSDYVLEAR